MKEYIAELDKRFSGIQSDEKKYAQIVTDSHFKQIQRIFSQGKASNGGMIGKYSTTSTLAGASSFITKSGFNKIAGSSKKRKGLKWATIQNGGKQVSLFEVSGGYKEIRSLDGRQTSKVDLSRSFDLRNDFSKSPFRVAPFSYVTGTRRNKNSVKIEGNEERFGKIFALSKKESKNHSERVNVLLTQHMQGD